MKQTELKPIVRKDHYQLIADYLHKRSYQSAVDRNNAAKLEKELKRASLVNPEDFPDDAIGLYSKVKVKTRERNDIQEMVLVTPDEVNLKENKISVMAPISIALLGFRQGQEISWKMPTGMRTYDILEVRNQ